MFSSFVTMADHPSSRRLNSLTASSPTQSTKQQQHRHSHWRHDFPLSFSLFSTYKDIPAMSELEGRSRPIQRHTGFDVGSSADVSESSRSARIRTTTNGTIVKGSDGDIDMSDDKKGVQPLPIPGSFEQRVGGNGTTQAPYGLLNSPDTLLLSHSAQGNRTEKVAEGVRLPSILSPQMTAISSSQVSSGPASISSSSHWSPGKSSDPHLYSISSQPYVYSSVKPYLSTSFQTSAERGGASASGSGSKLNRHNDMDQDDDDDVFGNTSHALGLLSAGEPSPPQLRRSNDMEREDGDAAGVFSFSSPCFGPRSLEQSYIPPLSPPPTDSRKRSQRLMSPGWTAATLGKLSLNGASPDGSSSAARRPALGPSSRQSSNLGNSTNMSAIHSRSLPSNAGMVPLNDRRRLSFNRRPPPIAGSKSYHLAGAMAANGNMLHPNTPYHRSASSARSRSTSRNRAPESGTPRSNMHRSFADVDDDETDEEAMVMDGQVEVEDDDATEDEAEQRTNRFKAQSIRGPSRYYDDAHSPATSIGAPVPLHRHPSGQPTTMSASYERANSGLNRQYTSERYSSAAASHYAMSRHHPYAISSSGASPSNAGVLSSYSPGNARVGMARRRSSFGNGSAAASPQQSHSMVHQLSHSPRYVNAPYQPHPSSHPVHAYQATAYHYGESQDSAGMRRPVYAPSSGLGRERGHRDDEEEEEDEDEEEEEDDEGEEDGDAQQEEADLRRDMTIKRKPPSHNARSTSQTRPTATMALSGTGDVESSEMNEVNAIRERLGGAANCSAFISKLWYLMCRPELYAKYIHWSESGDSVILSNDPDINNEFAAAVLPKLFKHGNNASFVRQLNLYGFQRVPSSRLLDAAEARAAKSIPSNINISTALQLYGPHSSFAHPRFKKDQEVLLPSMKPRSSKKTKKTAHRGDSEQEDEYAN